MGKIKVLGKKKNYWREGENIFSRTTSDPTYTNTHSS